MTIKQVKYFLLSNKNSLVLFLGSLLSIIILLVYFYVFAIVSADSLNNGLVIFLDKNTVKKGYTLSVDNKKFRLALTPNIMLSSTGAVIKVIDKFDVPNPKPWKRVGKVYEFDIQNKKFYNNKKPLIIQFNQEKSVLKRDYIKKVYYWDKIKYKWQPLPTKLHYSKKKSMIFINARSFIHLPYARLALFENTNKLGYGNISWYDQSKYKKFNHKNGNFTASTEYPIGSKLKVTNIDNNKSILVKINDFGPNKNIYPNRILDLDKSAFNKLSKTWKGTFLGYIEPVYIAHSKGSVLGIEEKNPTYYTITSQIDKQNNQNFSQCKKFLQDNPLYSKAAIIINVKTGKILCGKNTNEALPIASLTKLVAVDVFLDSQNLNTGIDWKKDNNWNKVVAYNSDKDDSVLKYGSKAEISYLYLKNGDLLTIKDLVFSSLIGSTNNSIMSLVRISKMSNKKFVMAMNRKVRGWGLSKTEFVDPTGLNPHNISSANEYAIIAKNVLKKFVILEATTRKKYVFVTKNTHKKHIIRNTNRLLNSDLYITGGKTGFLNEAGYCLMTKAKNKQNKEVIAVVLGTPEWVDGKFGKNIAAKEVEQLIKFGFTSL